MGRKPNLSKDTIASMVSSYKAGLSIKAIVEDTGVSERSVRRWLKLCSKTNFAAIPSPKKPPGKPRKVSGKTLRVIRRQLHKAPGLSSREVKERNQQLLENVSVRTVSRYIKKTLKIPSRRAAKKPRLTDSHKKARIAFAKKYSALPLEKIRAILWSDESVFTVTGTGSGRVRRPVGADRYDPRYILETVKHPQTVMVWGSFSYHGVGKLVFLEKGTTMNGNRYLELLCDHLADCFDKCEADLFQQDGASCHTSRCVRQWLDDCGQVWCELHQRLATK